MIALLRRLVCSVKPDWHRGFVSEQRFVPPGVHEFNVALWISHCRSGPAPTVWYWTRPRCVDCGELEID